MYWRYDSGPFSASSVGNCNEPRSPKSLPVASQPGQNTNSSRPPFFVKLRCHLTNEAFLAAIRSNPEWQSHKHHRRHKMVGRPKVSA